MKGVGEEFKTSVIKTNKSLQECRIYPFPCTTLPLQAGPVLLATAIAHQTDGRAQPRITVHLSFFG